MVLPKTKGKSISEFWNLSEASTDRILTICGWRFGTSIPIVPLPGIGAIILIPKALRLSAMSSSNDLILLMRTPASGTISYRVTVGPTVALILEISIL